MPDNLSRSSRKSDAQKIILPQKCIICDKINKYKNKKLLPLISCERKYKDTGQCMIQESNYAAATTLNDDRILYWDFVKTRIFLQQKQGITKNVTYSTWNKPSRMKNKRGSSKVKYEITEEETVTCLMK